MNILTFYRDCSITDETLWQLVGEGEFLLQNPHLVSYHANIKKNKKRLVHGCFDQNILQNQQFSVAKCVAEEGGFYLHNCKELFIEIYW